MKHPFDFTLVVFPSLSVSYTKLHSWKRDSLTCGQVVDKYMCTAAQWMTRTGGPPEHVCTNLNVQGKDHYSDRSAKIVLWSLKSFKHKIFGFFLHKLFCNRHWQYRNETFEHYVGALSTRAKARTCIHSFRLLSNVKSVIYNHFL